MPSGLQYSQDCGLRTMAEGSGGGGGWHTVPPRGKQARAKPPLQGGAGGAGGGRPREPGQGVGPPGGGGRTQGVGRPPWGVEGRGGWRGAQGGPPRVSRPRASLEVRPNTVCLYMDGFDALPSEAEFVQWLDETLFSKEPGTRAIAFNGFKYLNVDTFKKRFLISFNQKEEARAMLRAFESHGEDGALWPGLEHDVRVRAQSMEELSIEITVLDVAPETSLTLVEEVMGKFGEVKRCVRMRLPEPYNHVQVNKVKVEMVRNKETMPNIIHALGTAYSCEDFLTWKLSYRGCPRYCFGCGDTTHEVRHCPKRGLTKAELGKMMSVVGEVREGGEEGEREVPKLTYAAVLKDPSFMVKQQQEKASETLKAQKLKEDQDKKKEEQHLREEVNKKKRDEKKLAEQKKKEDFVQMKEKELKQREEWVMREKQIAKEEAVLRAPGLRELVSQEQQLSDHSVRKRSHTPPSPPLPDTPSKRRPTAEVSESICLDTSEAGTEVGKSNTVSHKSLREELMGDFSVNDQEEEGDNSQNGL